jgi:ABC-type sugar transport system substrate-binding protein
MRSLLPLLLAIAVAPGCGPRDSGGPSTGKTIQVGMVPKLAGIPYFNACRQGAEEAARELGIDLVYEGPLTADAVRQSEIVNSWILRGFNVIAAAPNNPEAIATVLRKARERGIRVITWDTDSVADAREWFCNQASAQAIAETLADIIAGELGGRGRVALVSGTETAANQNTWMRLLREHAARKHPGISFVEPVEYPGEDDARAYQSVQGLLRRPDRPDGIIGMTSVSAPATAKAVFDAGLAGKVAVTGITLPSSLKTYIKNGTVKRFILWDPRDLGYLTVHVAKGLAAGSFTGGEIEAGRLGKRAARDGEVLLGPPLVFDAGNIDRYDF